MLTEAVSIFNNFLESFGSGTAVLHHFGAMLTGIFSKQIGKNIEELIFENAESKQNDRAQKDLQEAILKRYGYFNTGADLSTVQAENPALKEELEYAEKIFKLRGFITEAESKELSLLQEKIGQRAREIDIITKAKETLENLKQEIATEEIEGFEFLNDDSGLEEWEQAQKIANKKYVAAQKTEKIFHTHLSKLKDASGVARLQEEDPQAYKYISEMKLNKNSTIGDYFTKKDVDYDALAEEVAKYNDEVNILKTNLHQLETQLKATDISNEEYNQTLESFVQTDKDLEQALNNLDMAQEHQRNFASQEFLNEEELAQIAEQTTAAKEAQLKIQQKIKTVVAGMKAEEKMSLEELQEANEKDKEEIDYKLQHENRQKMISQTIQSVSILTQGLFTLSSAINIIIDDEMSVSEKLMSLIPSLMSIGTMLQPAINLLKTLNTTVLVNRQKNKEEIVAIALAATQEKNLTAVGKIQTILNLAKQRGVNITEKEIKQMLIKKALEEGNEKQAKYLQSILDVTFDKTKKVNLSLGGLTKIFQTKPVFAWAGAIGIAVTALMGFIALKKKEAEEARKTRDETIEEMSQARETNKELKETVKTYEDLYKQYEQGTISKEDLTKTTDKLLERLSDEDRAIIELTQDYEKMTEQVKEANKQIAKNNLANSTSKKKAAEKNLEEGVYGENFYSLYTLSGTNRKKERAVLKELEKSKVLKRNDRTKDVDIEADGEYADISYVYDGPQTAENKVKIYDELMRIKTEVEKLDAEEYEDSSYYKNIVKWLKKNKEDVETYKKALTEYNEDIAEVQGIEYDWDAPQTTKDFSAQRDKYIEKLKKELPNLTDEEIEILANEYVRNYSEDAQTALNKVINAGQIIDIFGKQYKDPILNSYDSLTSGEISALSDEDKVEEYKKLFDELIAKGVPAGEAIKAIGKAFANTENSVIILSSAFKDQLKQLGYSEEAFQEYMKQLQVLYPHLKNNNKLTKEIALGNVRLNKGYLDLVENFEDLGPILKKNERETSEFSDALEQTQDIMANLLNVKSGDILSTDFYTSAKNLKLMERAAKGSKEAIEELRTAAANDIIQQLQIKSDDEQIDQALNDINSKVQSYDLSDLKAGASIDDITFVNDLNRLIEQARMTKEQVENYLNAMDIDPEFEVDMVKVKTTQTHRGVYISGLDPVTNEPIQHPYEWETTEEILVPKIKSLNYLGDVSNRADTIKPSSAGNKGSKSKPKKEDNLKDEKDRYHDVNIELAQINNSLEEVQKQTDQLVGQDKIDNLRQQYALLNKEIETTSKKIEIAKGEMSELQNKLQAKGIQFNADGTIANYAAAYDAQLASVNNVINHFNSLGEDGQEAYQDTLDAAKENFEEFVENIEKYDDLLTDMIPGLQADIQDAINEQIEMKIEAFHQEIEIRLDMAEAEREWNEFYKNIIKDIDEDDILGNVTERLKDFMSYYKESAEGVIQVNTEHINQILSELKAMDENGVANVYGKDGTEYRKQALEDLQNYYQQLMSDLTNIHDLSDEIHESYVDMIDEAQEKFDEQIETFEKVNELLEHDKNVISMIYGEESYSALAQYYDKQEENNNKQLDFQKQQVEFWKQQMEIAEEGSDAWEAAKENWMSAVDEWNSAVEAAIENLQDKYLNAINAIFQNLNNQVTNGLGLDYTESQWELINKNADQYLDSVNSIYQVQQLQNKYLDAIEKTDSPAQQKRLNDLMKQETDYLREQDKLSQYDLDRANLKYEIALKQMALEEAQQNKTMLRLRRDSQGNYTYQYTADEDQVSSIQQEIADLYNQLYNLDAEEYRGNLEEIYDVWLEFQERMAEAAQINDPEQRAAKELLIKEQYGELINTLVEKNENAQANLYQSTMSHLFDLYNQNIVNYDEMSQEQRDILDQFMSAETDLSNAAFDNLFNLYNVNIESFKTMTDEQQEILMGSLVPQWNTAVQMMVDNIAGAGGFIPTCKEAFEEIDEATQDYMTGLEELQKNANVSFDELKDGIDETIIETEKLLEDNNELISSYEQEIEAIRGVIDELEELISKYQAASDAAKKATEDAYNYWLAEQDKNATIDATLPDPNEGITTTDNTPVNDQPAAPIEPPKPSLNIGSYVNVKAGSRWYRTSYGGGDGPARSGSIVLTNPGSNYPYNIDWLGWVSKSAIQGYDTGGYTGDWGSKDGRLAMLHQKELVLNANDTQNMLNAVEILRDITRNLGNTLFNKMAAISAGGTSAIANGVAAEGIEQNVHIDAQFPNVTNSHEIEDALNNLMNRASQFIQQSR